MNFISRSCSYSCSFRLISKPIDDQESNFRSQSFSQDSFNSSFSSKSSLPPSIAAVISTSNTLHHHCISTFKPNSSGVLSLTLVGNHLVSGTSTQIHLWPRHPTTTTTAGFIPIPCKSAVKSLQILNENILISAHQDRRIRIWDINKLKIVTTLPSLKDRLAKIMFAKNYVEIRQHKKLTWIHHNDAVSSLAVSMDKSLIYSASWDRSFKVWRSSDFKCLESISNAHDDAINAIVLSVEGFVYTGSADKKIKVWRHDRRDKKHYLIEKLEHHRSAVNALAYDDHASVLISGACSGAMIASERNSGGGDGGHMTVVGALIGHKKAILCVRIVGEFVCSGSADKTVRLWRRSAEKRYSCLGVLEGHGGPVKCLAMAAEISSNGEEEEEEEEEEEGKGYVVYSGSLDGDIKVWKVWVPFAMEEEPLVAKFEGYHLELTTYTTIRCLHNTLSTCHQSLSKLV